MTSILLRKTGFGLFATDAASEEALVAMKQEEVVLCKVTRPRNEKQLRLAFAILDKVYKSQTAFSDRDTFYRQIKFATGCFTRYVINGTVVTELGSLAFDNMEQGAFDEWWKKYLDVILTTVLPASGSPELEQEIYHMLGEPTAKDLAR